MKNNPSWLNRAQRRIEPLAACYEKGEEKTDTEFHIRCSDWYARQHHTGPRYNNIILHVVLNFDSAGPVLGHVGHAVPVCSLNDLVPAIFPQPLWPCQCIIPSMDAEARAALLQRAGMLRFEHIPEPAGRAAEPSPLDAGRLRISRQLVEQWRVKGAWETIRNAILYANVILRLRAIFVDLGPARSDILICNVVLPFAAAVAHFEQDQPLLEQVRDFYGAYAGLPSNQVTRSMYRQLGLEREPKNACQQQGLHYIYAQTCREKHCAACIVVGRDI